MDLEQQQQASARSPIALQGHAQALIVEGDHMTIEVITDLLRKRNVKADSACNGSKAIELFEERVRKVGRDQADMYSLILLDHNLPELDGPKIAK